MLPPESEYQKGYILHFNKRTKRPTLYVGLFHDPSGSQRGEIELSWSLATELGPEMRIRPDSFSIFSKIPEFFEYMATTSKGISRNTIVHHLKTIGYIDFSTKK